jgi:DNA-binding CsgD family transcriptional regulator
MPINVAELTSDEIELLALSSSDDPGRKYKSSDVLALCPVPNCGAVFWRRNYLVNGKPSPQTCGLRCGQRWRGRASGHGGLNLTKREAELRELLDQGYTNSAIAARMGITVGTLRNMVSSVYRKAG